MQPFILARRIKLTSSGIGAVPNLWQSWFTACRSISGPLPRHLVYISRKGSALTLQWRHTWGDGVSNHQHGHCLLNRLLRRRSKQISNFRITGLCEGNSPVTGEFPAQLASNARNVTIWWLHHDLSDHTQWRHGGIGEYSPKLEHFWGPHGVSDENLIRLYSN